MTLAERVAWALNQLDNKNDPLAKKLGIHKNTIAAYRECKGDLKGVIFEALVKEFDLNPVWLLTGQGKPFTPPGSHQATEDVLDVELLEGVIEWLEHYLANNRQNLPSDKKARFISFAYQYFKDTGKSVSDGEMERYLKLVA